jgi:hypothetical protein
MQAGRIDQAKGRAVQDGRQVGQSRQAGIDGRAGC